MQFNLAMVLLNPLGTYWDGILMKVDRYTGMMALWPSMIGIQKLLSPHFHLPYMVKQKLLDKKLYVYSHLFLQSHIFLCLGEDGMAFLFCIFPLLS